MNPGITWFVVADGARARIFEQARPGVQIRELEHLSAHAPPFEQPRDRPPRVHDRMGPGRHIVAARTPPRAAAENAFLRDIAQKINAAGERGAFSKLALCAPPHALGILRNNLSDTARRMLARELVKDLTHETAADIAKRLDTKATA